ncbi:MAG: serine hydrolase [Firmicutes bacterium]|nr:serine hydrolase [Bacillota bacterium]
MRHVLERATLLTLTALALIVGLWAIPRPLPPRVSPETVQPKPSPTVPAPSPEVVIPTAARPNYAPLRKAMLDFIAGYPGIRYGIYFKDLISGAAFGINEWQVFPAASTIKVPLVLYLNELVAAGKLDWQDKVVYMSELDWQGGAGALQFFAQDGYKYSLRVLANLTITISDNISTRMLLRYLGKENFKRYLWSMGASVVYPGGRNESTPRDMALYLEAVLNFAKRHPDGRRLLDDMANPIWHVGLPGQLPDHITVAHKEGDLPGVAADIGIVYGSRPYILVVMSEGVPNDEIGFENIATLSKIAYDYQERLAGR